MAMLFGTGSNTGYPQPWRGTNTTYIGVVSHLCQAPHTGRGTRDKKGLALFMPSKETCLADGAY